MTPTEDLVLEVLAARYRLGHQLWTFKSRHSRVINSLVEQGLVFSMHGVVEKTVRAGLTEKGMDAVLSPRYQSQTIRVGSVLDMLDLDETETEVKS